MVDRRSGDKPPIEYIPFPPSDRPSGSARPSRSAGREEFNTTVPAGDYASERGALPRSSRPGSGSGGATNARARPYEHLDELLNQSGSIDRYVPSDEAIIESVINYNPDRAQVKAPPEEFKSVGSVIAPPEVKSPGGPPGKPGGPKKLTDEPFGRKVSVMLGILCVIVGLLLLSFYISPLQGGFGRLVGLSSDNANPSPSASGSPLAVELPISKVSPVALAPIKVYVVGAVKKPGIVELPFDSRVDDAIRAVGGMTNNADPVSINLAKRLRDEDQIFVREKRSELDSTGQSQVSEPPSDGGVSEWSGSYAAEPSEPSEAPETSAPQAPASSSVSEGPSIPKSTAPASNASGRININTATVADFTKLKGVGLDTACRIVEYRNSLPGQSFSSVEELENVNGIGPAKMSTIRPLVEL